jgi:putative alpha-1,2-mannosidase
MVPQDLPGLFRLMGGRAIGRLDLLFRKLNAGPDAPYYWGGNEPGLEIPWEYDAAGAPWRTQQIVRRIATQLYSASPGGLPGNDDLGTLSAWYVWAALGLYPMVPGVAGFAVGTPLFPHIDVSTGSGRLTIVAPDAETRPYIEALSVNRHPYADPWLPLSRLGRRSVLQFTLSATPARRWGARSRVWPRP